VPPRRNQDHRRRQLIEAAFVTLARRGLQGTRTSDIAREAGVAVGSIHYYFATKDELILEATRWDIDRFYRWLVDELADVDDPLERLLSAIRWTLPDDSGDPGWVVAFQFWARSIYSPPLAALSALLQERARTLYVTILTDGHDAGRFTLRSDAESVARSLMAMIDGLSFQVILKDPSLTAADAERLCVDYALMAVGLTAAELP
jgi:AcrR family transcriptional regulator